MNTLLVYTDYFDHINTIKEYGASFQKYSKHLTITKISLESFLVNIIYNYNYSLSHLIYLEQIGIINHSEYFRNEIDIKNYKTIIFFYNNNYFLLDSINTFIFKKLEQKNTIMFIQDEYQETIIKSNILKKLNIDLCFVNVNQEDASIIFNNNVSKFKTVLTGYVPDIQLKKKLIKDRQNHIFYRATPLDFIYGDLGQEKINIGKIMKLNGIQKQLNLDIEWEMDKKIFGEKWYECLSNSKTTLATECGCKVFDWEPRNTEIQQILKENPDYTYEEAKKDFKIEPMYDSCQVSPKMFESVKLGTVLIMYEGEYKGIFKPNVHYIELKKDHSNIESVIEKIKDDDYLQNIADRAYTDIIEKGKYTYKDFIEYFDSVVKENFTNM